MSKVFKEEKGYVVTGYVEADNINIRNIILNCGFSALGIYLVILSHRNTNDGRCFPSLGTIASECSCKKKNIQNHIDKLINEGFLIVNSGKSGKANNYYFPLESFYKDEGKDAYKRIIVKDSTTTSNIVEVEEFPAIDDNKVTNIVDDIPSLAGECFDLKKFTYNDLTDAQKKMVDVGLSTVEQYSKSKEELFTEDMYKSIDEGMENYNNSMVGISEDELNILDERASQNLASNNKFKPVGKYVDEVEEYDPLDGMFEEDIIIPKISDKDKIEKQHDDLVASMNHNKTYVENGITYDIDKNGFSYRIDEVRFDYVPDKPKKRKNSIENDEFLAYLDNL